MSVPSILLIEDDERTRAHLGRILSGDPRVELVASASNVSDGRRALETLRPDVLITDIELPDGSGIDLIRAIEPLGLETLAMVITVFGDEKTVIEALEAGALGYLLKDGSADYLVRSTLELLQGGSPISSPIARYLLRRFGSPPAVETSTPSDVPSLSGREHEVLEYLMKGFTYAEIASLIGVTPHTVATHVRRIYQKLAVRSRGEAVYEALQLGILKSD